MLQHSKNKRTLVVWNSPPLTCKHINIKQLHIPQTKPSIKIRNAKRMSRFPMQFFFSQEPPHQKFAIIMFNSWTKDLSNKKQPTKKIDMAYNTDWKRINLPIWEGALSFHDLILTSILSFIELKWNFFDRPIIKRTPKYLSTPLIARTLRIVFI